MKLTKSLLVATLIFTAATNAQEEKKADFSLSGEFRPRTEWFGHGQSATALKGTEGYVATSVRAALNATYKTESYTTYLSFQEVFNYGDRHQIKKTGNGNLRIQEAWASLTLSEKLNLKIGRQPLSYDDQRILGGLGWAQQARTHDVAIFKYQKEGYFLDLGYGLNSEGKDNVYDTSDNFSYREIAFARANKKYGDFNISALVLANTFQDNLGTGNSKGAGTGTNNKSTLLTAGLHLDYKLDNVLLSANGYIQDGQRLKDVNVEGAYLASLKATLKATEKTSYNLGGEIISGKTNSSAAFFPLYGTNHAFNGLMDRFYVGNHGNNGGLIDIQAGAATKIAGFKTSLQGHYFLEQSQGGDDLGAEIDLTIAKKFNGYKVVAGYSQFFESNAAATAKDIQNWAWVMLIIKPNFL